QPVPASPAPRVTTSAEELERRGRSLTEAGKYQEAIAELSEAIRLKPDFARAYNARGYAYLLKRDYQHAQDDFNEAIRLMPDYGNAYRNRAATRKAMGDATGAAADLAKAR